MSEDFPKGLHVKRNSKAPDFVICSLSIKENEFAEYMAHNVNGSGYVNIDILRSSKGNLYPKLNDFKPDVDAVRQETGLSPEMQEEANRMMSGEQQSFDDIPF